MEHQVDAVVWRYPAAGGWRFVTLPPEIADDLAAAGEPSSFGSVRVVARLGSSVWQTSIFPSKADATYLLPIKAAVRTSERIEDGDQVTVTLRVADAPSGPGRGDAMVND